MRPAHHDPSATKLRPPKGVGAIAPVGTSGRASARNNARNNVRHTSRPLGGWEDRRHKGTHERTISPVAKGITPAHAGQGAPNTYVAGNDSGRHPARSSSKTRNSIDHTSQHARASGITRGKASNPSHSCPRLRASHLSASTASGWQEQKGFAADPSVESIILQMTEPKMPKTFVPTRDSVARGDAHAVPSPTSVAWLSDIPPHSLRVHAAGVAHRRVYERWPSPGGGPAAER